MTCAEADRIRREGPSLTVERLDGAARFSYEAILTEQQEAKVALLASGVVTRPLTIHQHGLVMWLADLVAEEILSSGESGGASARACASQAEAPPAASPDVLELSSADPATCGKVSGVGSQCCGNNAGPLKRDRSGRIDAL